MSERSKKCCLKVYVATSEISYKKNSKINQILIIFQVKNLLLVMKMHSKFGKILSRIKETGTILRCKGESVAPNMAADACDDFRTNSTIYEINM